MSFANELDFLFSRRRMIQGMIGASSASVISIPSAFSAVNADANGLRAPVKRSIDLTDPAQNLEAYVKLVGNLDPTIETAGWFGGDIFAVTEPDKPLRKLFGVEGMGVLRIESQSDGTYRAFNRECAFYTDAESGEYIDSWNNPFINEEVEVASIHNMTVNAELAPVFKMDFDGEVQEVPFLPPWIVQDQIDTAMSLFELHVAPPNPLDVKTWPRESAGPINRISEIFQRSARLSDLQNTDLTGCSFDGVWTRVGPWLPWMLQGQAPGHIMYRTFMTKPGRLENMPERFLKQVSDKLGEQYFSAPKSSTWGAQNDSSFTVYMSENRPAAQE